MVLCIPEYSIYASEHDGAEREDQARVYLIQGEGKKRHVFAGEHWLGTVDKDSYTFSYVDPGEYLIWTDKADFEWLYLSSGKTYYLEVTGKSITMLDEPAGKTSVEKVGVYRAPTDKDRRQAEKKVWKYDWVRRRAAASGTYDPCRFVAEKQVEYEKRAIAGDGKAQHDLAKMYWTGDCIEEDRTTALKWFRQSAEQGHALSAFLLGNIYSRGLEAPIDPKEAARWFHLAARYGTHVVQRYSRQWLNENDPEYQEAQQREAESKARVEAEQKKLHEERRKRREAQRLTDIRHKYGQLGLVVVPIEGEVSLEQPRRKRPAEKVSTNRGDNGITYMLPPEFALGVLAAGWVLGVIETAIDSRLSSEDKEKIKEAEVKLSQAFLDRGIARDLRQRIVKSSEFSTGESLFKAMAPSIGIVGDADHTMTFPEISTVLEVKTAGVGLVLADKKYRPSQFVMSNEVRLVRRQDGTVLQDASICYTSPDTPNFSEWAIDGQKLLHAELESAYTYTAEEVLQLVAGEVGETNTASLGACAKLKEKVPIEGPIVYESFK